MTAFLTDTFPSKCEAAKRKAAGKLASGKLACYSKAAAKGVAVDSGCLSKAIGKFSAALFRATGHPCLSVALVKSLVRYRRRCYFRDDPICNSVEHGAKATSPAL